MRPVSFFASVASILKAVAHRHGIETPLFEHRLRRRWSEIVGDQLAAHTRPDLIRFKKLYLIVENSVWLQQLTFLKPTLIEKVNAAADGPVVSDIVLRVGEIARAPREGERQMEDDSRDEAGPTPESVAQAAARAAIVKDPELRERLTMVIANAPSPRPPDPATRTDRERPT